MKKRKLRKEIKIGLVLFLSISIFTVLGTFVYLFLNPVCFESSPYTIELKKEFNPKDAIRFVAFGNKEDVKIKGTLDTSKEGKYTLIYTYNNKDYPLEFRVKDTQPPKVIFKDVKTDLVQKLKPKDFIKSIQDASKTTVSFVDKTKLSRKGEQTVELTIKDKNNNTTTGKAKLIRYEDKKAPEFSKMKTYKFKQGSLPDYKKGMKIKDDLDQNPKITVDDSNVNSFKPGTYTIRYTATDRTGNRTIKERKVIVTKNPEYGNKVVYLTFDDGPSKNTMKILDILKKYNVKATFFVTGTHPENNKYIKQAYEEGHSIALHTYSHRYNEIYASKEAYYDDLKKIQDMVKEITGKKVKIVRFPGGSSNTISSNTAPGLMTVLTQELINQGYQYFDWNVDSTDASGNNVPVKQIIENSTQSNLDYINILMHDTDAKDTTVDALPKIIKHYKQNGYLFAGIDLDSYAPHHGILN